MSQEKVYQQAATALVDVFDGATILIAGFAGQGLPEGLLRALHDQGASGLTCVCQGAWRNPRAKFDLARLVEAGRVRKLVGSLPLPPGEDGAAAELWRAGKLEIEVLPQGTLAERIRAGGAGLGGVFIPTGVGTRFAQGQEVRSIGGRECVYLPPLKADFALLRAAKVDTLGNTVYRGTQRNWNPLMAMAASVSVVEADQIVEPGGIDPEEVITPGIFINRIVRAVY